MDRSELPVQKNKPTPCMPGAKISMPPFSSRRGSVSSDQRLLKTRSAIERELAVGAFVYRYSRAKGGAFVACSCWLVEAYACLGDVPQAKECWRPFLALLETILASSTSRSIRRPEWPWAPFPKDLITLPSVLFKSPNRLRGHNMPNDSRPYPAGLLRQVGPQPDRAGGIGLNPSKEG